MSVEQVVQLIEREAEAESSRIVAEAEASAARLVAEAEERIESHVAEALEREGPQIRAAAQRRINAVRLRLLEERARDDAARLMTVFEAAEERLDELAASGSDERWAAALERLGSEALASVGRGATVALRSRDAPAIAATAERWAARVEILDDDAPAGLVARAPEGRIEVDARLSVRMERARALLAETVANALALTPGDVGPVQQG